MNRFESQFAQPRAGVLADPLRSRALGSSVSAATAFSLIILITVYEGAARKWLFPNSAAIRYAAYFSKDIVFILVGYWALRCGSRAHLPWLPWCAFLILIPSAGATLLHSNIIGVWLSFRAYILLPLCAFLAAPLTGRFRDVERCALTIAIASLPVAILGIYQYSLPKSHFLNCIESGGELLEGISRYDHVRASGTFMSVGGMGLMAGFTAWAGIFLALPIAGRRRWVCLVGLAALGAALICAAAAMSRSGLVLWCVTVLGGLMLYLRASQSLIWGAVVVAIVLMMTGDPSEDLEAIQQQDTLASGLTTRVTESGAFTGRISYIVNNFVIGISSFPLGNGLGTGQSGGKYVSGDQSKSLESEWGRIATEVGPLGLIGVLGIRCAAIVACWRALRRTADPHRRWVIATAIPYFCVMATSKMAFNHVGNVFAWTVMAFALAASFRSEKKYF